MCISTKLLEENKWGLTLRSPPAPCGRPGYVARLEAHSAGGIARRQTRTMVCHVCRVQAHRSFGFSGRPPRAALRPAHETQNGQGRRGRRQANRKQAADEDARGSIGLQPPRRMSERSCGRRRALWQTQQEPRGIGPREAQAGKQAAAWPA